MPADADPPTAPPPRPPLFWWCLTCGRSADFDRDQLARYAREGWPVCCGAEALVRSRDAGPAGPGAG